MTNFLIIDDQPSCLDVANESLESLAKIFDATFINSENGEGAIDIFSKPNNISLVIVDLDLQSNLNGIEVIYNIRSINPYVPIFICSGFTNELYWKEQLNMLPEDYNVGIIEKPFPIRFDPKYKEIVNQIKYKCEEYIALNPFNLDLKTYIQLTEIQRDNVNTLALAMNSHFINQHFNNTEDDYVIIGQNAGKILMSGSKYNEPFEDDLYDLAKDIKKPVFAYSRSKVIEEINGWSKRNEAKDDYYPTIYMRFENKSKEFVFHLDTGSEESYLSREMLQKYEIITQAFFGFRTIDQAEFLGENFHYYKEKKNVSLFDDHTQKTFGFKFNAVSKWTSSPFVKIYKDRLGLVGRNLLNDNSITLILNGESKKTKIGT